MGSDPVTALQPTDELAGTLKRTEVQRGSSSIPGREIVQVLTEIPVGVQSGWHSHPGEEVGYIVDGTVEMRIRGEQSLTLRAGDGFLMPPGRPHNAVDLGPGTGQMLSTYIVEIGQPLVTLEAATGAGTAEDVGVENTYRLHLRSDEFQYEAELHAT